MILESIRNYMTVNKYPIIITGVMFGIFATIAVLTTGDLGEAIARTRKR